LWTCYYLLKFALDSYDDKLKTLEEYNELFRDIFKSDLLAGGLPERHLEGLFSNSQELYKQFKTLVIPYNSIRKEI